MAVALFLRWVLALAILAAYGCQSTPGGQPSEDPALGEGMHPEALLQRAQMSQGRQAAELYLQASQGFIAANLFDEARVALAGVVPDLLPVHQLGDYETTGIELSLATGDIKAARAQLDAATHLRSTPAIRIAQLRARVCDAEGDHRCAVSTLSKLRGADEERQEIHDLIWIYLGHAPAFTAAQQAELVRGVEQGWWALKATMLQSFSIADQRRRLSTWRNRWPRHPASSLLPRGLQELDSEQWQPQKVGLLLPLSGPLARAGRAVRDGFVSAYLHAEQPSSTASSGFQVVVYDAAAESVGNLYERALLDGVELLVGPLSKDTVAALNDLNPEIPTLALNYLDPTTVPAANLYQLGLAIEDEADSIVTRLLEDGAERLLVFHNYEDWSLRAVRRLSANWPFSITVQPFVDVKTVTESVGRAMQVEASQERRSELGKLLSFELEFLPRARQDVDAVVALVNTVEANAMVPALRFHFAQALPVYASSQSVRGAQSDQLRELNGFRVSELPWYLFSDPLYQDMDGTFVLRGNPLSSLYALGVDAFRVSDRLPLLGQGSANQLLGSTGILTLHNSGKFVREMAWGVINSGQIVPLPLIVQPQVVQPRYDGAGAH